MDDELQELRKQVKELTELYNLQSQRAADYAGAFMRSKREWVGLTDEDRAEAWAKTKGDLLLRLPQFSLAIETKLKEKNGAV